MPWVELMMRLLSDIEVGQPDGVAHGVAEALPQLGPNHVSNGASYAEVDATGAARESGSEQAIGREPSEAT